MNYADEQEVRLGDRVKMRSNEGVGIVVFSVDTDEYSDGYPREMWDYLKKGAGIEFPEYGLVYFEESDEDIRLVTRKQPK